MPVEIRFICEGCGAVETIKHKKFVEEIIWPNKHGLYGSDMKLLCPECKKLWWKRNVKPGDIMA